MRIIDPLLDFCIEHKKDIYIIGEIETPLKLRLEAAKYKIYKTLEEVRRHKETFTEPVAYTTEQEVDVSDFIYKVILPKPEQKPWCYQWCLESEIPLYIETNRSQYLNSESNSTCAYCKQYQYFLCKYDSCVDIDDLMDHDYTDCRKRCQIEKMTKGTMKPCLDGETIYEKAGWTFETNQKPATFQGKEVR